MDNIVKYFGKSASSLELMHKQVEVIADLLGEEDRSPGEAAFLTDWYDRE